MSFTIADRSPMSYSIVAIDDEPFFLELISDSLKDHDVVCSPDGDGLDGKLDGAELIIMDVHLENETGYDVCRRVREINADIPVLFVSAMQDLEARLKAYGCGGNDYITKPFQSDELALKTNTLVSHYRRTQHLKSELKNRSDLMLDIQRESSDIQIINRFTLSGSQCKDFNTLTLLFFYTLNELGLEGVLSILDHSPQSSTDSVSRLESEILDLGNQLPRIHSFGKQRALYNWANCRLLVRDIGPHIDTIAILMDALEVSIDRIKHEDNLLQQIVAIEQYSTEIKNRLAEILEMMKDKISDELLSLGVVSSLTWEEEERIKEILEKYTKEFQLHFIEQEMHNCNLRDAIEKLRTAHPNLYKQLETMLNESDDGLF